MNFLPLVYRNFYRLMVDIFIKNYYFRKQIRKQIKKIKQK